MKNFEMMKVEALLCQCIRHCDYLNQQKILKMYEEVGDRALYDAAQLNGVTSIVAHALNICVNSGDLPAYWSDEYIKVEQKILAYMAELDKVANLLAQNDIPLIALKNSGITRGMYPYYGACPMGDIDVLVSPSQFRDAHRILTEHGYQLKFRCEFEEDSLEEAEKGGGAEYSVHLEDGRHLWFELQWRPVAGRWIQPDQEPRADELIERSISISGTKARLLAPEDNLLQVALHTAKHTFVRAPGFRLHTDVDRIVRTQEVDWPIFVNRVKKLRTRTAVFMSLAMAKILLDTPIPNEVLSDLKPGKWKVRLMQAWLQKVGIFEPDAKKWSRFGYIVFVTLLYDSFSDFISGLFPSAQKMKAQYGFTSNLYLPYYHAKRLASLLLKRVNT